MSRPRATLSDERGFSLVELLVTMTLGIVVLLAVLGASDMFARTTSIADKTTAAQDSARATVRGMVDVLRQARTVCPSTCPTAIPAAIGGTPTRSSLVVATYVTTAPGVEAKGWVRYCATADAHPSLLMGTRVGDLYAAPGPCSASDTTNGWHYAVVVSATLQDSASLFDYTTSTCSGATCTSPVVSDIQSVGIRVAVGTSPGAAAAHNSVVRDAVSFRNRSSS